MNVGKSEEQKCAFPSEGYIVYSPEVSSKEVKGAAGLSEELQATFQSCKSV